MNSPGSSEGKNVSADSVGVDDARRACAHTLNQRDLITKACRHIGSCGATEFSLSRANGDRILYTEQPKNDFSLQLIPKRLCTVKMIRVSLLRKVIRYADKTSANIIYVIKPRKSHRHAFSLTKCRSRFSVCPFLTTISSQTFWSIQI